MSRAAAEKPGATIDVAALRRAEFPWLDRGDTIYLNCASTGPLPARTLRAIDTFGHRRAQPHKISADAQFSVLTRARELAAPLIGATPGEIALTVNTSYGLNFAARALPLVPGDEVILSDGEFPANVYPWLALEQVRGVRAVIVPCRDGLPDEDALVAALERPRAKVLTVSWVQFATGHRADVMRLGRACRARGAFFVVDAIQGVGVLPLDVRASEVDVLACGAQKWLLSPWGSGFTYVRRELVPELAPPTVGWLSVSGAEDFARLTDYDLTWLPGARRFEPGTLPYQDFAGMNASLELLEELGLHAIAAHVSALADRIVAWAQARDGVRLVTAGARDHRAGIVAVAPSDAAAASSRLDAAGVVHSFREGMIRLSPHLFNTAEDIDRALALL